MSRSRLRTAAYATLLWTLSGTAQAADEGLAAADECEQAGNLQTQRIAPEGCYVDRDGKLRHAHHEYKRRIDALDPDYVRALGQQLLALGIGTFWYWADTDRNVADWDFPAWKQRFTLEAWTFDNNHFPINKFGHAFNGGMFYAFPRANELSMPIAASYGFVTSFAWEFLIEFREKVSINDFIVTSGAGLTIGEFAAKFWRYFAGVPAEANTAQLAAATTFGIPVWVHRAADGKPQHVDGPYDRWGFSSAIGHYLEVGYQGRLHDYGDDTRYTHGAFLGGRLSSIPGEGRPGSFSMFFHDADITSLHLAASVGEKARELSLTTDTHLLGLYHQEIDDKQDGHATVLGLSLGYLYRFQDFEGYNDRLGILHMPGPGSDFFFRQGSTRLSTHARISGDFAGIHSAAFPEWAAANVGPDDKTKSILTKHGYYYGWGISTRFGAELVAPPFDIKAQAMLGTYDSQEGLDRAQSDVTLDVDAKDRVLELGTSLGFTVPTTSLRGAIGWSASKRKSRVGTHTVDRTLQTLTTSIGASM
jgi:hypothetical protein